MQVTLLKSVRFIMPIIVKSADCIIDFIFLPEINYDWKI